MHVIGFYHNQLYSQCLPALDSNCCGSVCNRHVKAHWSYAHFIITRPRLRGAGIYMQIGVPRWICWEVSAPVGVCCLMSLPPLLNSALRLLQVTLRPAWPVRSFLEFEATTNTPGYYVENFADIMAVQLDMGIWGTEHVTAMLNLWSWFVVKIWTDGRIKVWKFTAVPVYWIWIFVFYSSIFRKVKLYSHVAKFCARLNGQRT